MINDHLQAIALLFENCFTFQNLSFVLGLIGSLGTAWSILQNRKKIKLVILRADFDSAQRYIIHMQFLNLSRLPIAISDVCLQLNGVLYPCEKEPYIVSSSTHKRLGQVLIRDFYTQPFPLQLGGLGGMSSYLAFELPPDTYINPSTPLTLQISSNRGKVLVLKVRIPQKDDSE